MNWIGRTLRSALRDVARKEDGSMVALIAISMTALLGMAALAVDVGMLMSARAEAQRTADLAALAGAGILIAEPANAMKAEQTAINFAAQNNINGQAAVVQSQDVDVDLPNGLVRVRVHRSTARGNPVGTFFARVFGVNTVDVGATAAAQTFPGGGGNCLLPVALPDKWVNLGGPQYDPADGDLYVPPGQSGYTGYTDADIGTQFVLKPAQGQTGGPSGGTSGSFEPGWWYLWTPSGPGASLVRDYVTGCPDPNAVTSTGDWVTDKNGNMQAIERDFEDLIAQDPYASYDPVCNCVTGGMGMGSPRIRGAPVFEPTTYSHDGSQANFQVAGFAGVFIEAVSPGPPGKRNVLARIMGFSATDPTGGVGGGTALANALRLVE